MSYLPLHPGLRISVSQVEFLPWIEKKLKSYSKYFSSVFLNCISQCGTCGRECCNLLLNYVARCVSQSYVSAVFLKLRHFWNVFLKSLYFWNVFVTLRHFWNVFLKKSISEMYFSKKVFLKCISQWSISEMYFPTRSMWESVMQYASDLPSFCSLDDPSSQASIYQQHHYTYKIHSYI